MRLHHHLAHVICFCFVTSSFLQQRSKRNPVLSFWSLSMLVCARSVHKATQQRETTEGPGREAVLGYPLLPLCLRFYAWAWLISAHGKQHSPIRLLFVYLLLLFLSVPPLLNQSPVSSVHLSLQRRRVSWPSPCIQHDARLIPPAHKSGNLLGETNNLSWAPEWPRGIVALRATD